MHVHSEVCMKKATAQACLNVSFSFYSEKTSFYLLKLFTADEMSGINLFGNAAIVLIMVTYVWFAATIPDCLFASAQPE